MGRELRQFFAPPLVWLLVTATAAMGGWGSSGHMASPNTLGRQAMLVVHAAHNVDIHLAQVPTMNFGSGSCCTCDSAASIAPGCPQSGVLAAALRDGQTLPPDHSVLADTPPPRT